MDKKHAAASRWDSYVIGNTIATVSFLITGKLSCLHRLGKVSQVRGESLWTA